MITNTRFSLLFLLAVTLGLSTSGACAQSFAPDEAVGPNGITQRLQLSPVQRRAIYNAVMRQRVHGSNGEIPAIVGAPVPASAALSDIPDQAALAGVGDGLLKYATVAGEVVLVDPIRMRVVDVIDQGAGS
jgi:Protein of unknown function (DUF1236)